MSLPIHFYGNRIGHMDLNNNHVKGANKLTQTDKYIRIVRYANERFQLKKFMLSEYIYHGEVHYSYPIEIQIDSDPLLSAKSSTVEACYCHFYQFDTKAFGPKGIMGMREGHDLNIGYLPADQPVYVRAVDENFQPILQYFRIAENPFDHTMYRFDEHSNTDKFTWVKMRLSDAVQRNDKYLKSNEVLPEKLSEMLLTTDSKNTLVDVICKNFRYSFHKKYPPTKNNTQKSFLNRLLFK